MWTLSKTTHFTVIFFAQMPKTVKHIIGKVMDAMEINIHSGTETLDFHPDGS